MTSLISPPYRQRRTTPLVMFVILAVFLAACSDPDAAAEPSAAAAPSTPVREPTELPTQEPTAVPTAAPLPTDVPTAPPSPSPTTVPTATVAPEPTTAPTDAGDPPEPATVEPVEEPTPATTTPTTPDSLGASVYAASCTSCHGDTGGGVRGKGPSIIGIGVFFVEDRSPLTDLVTHGGDQMPEFATKLSADEIDAVVQYVIDTFQ